jgi:hypothetical protein
MDWVEGGAVLEGEGGMIVHTHQADEKGQCVRCGCPIPLVMKDGKHVLPRFETVGIIESKVAGRSAYFISDPTHDSNRLCAP